MNELKPCPFCETALYPGRNVHRKAVMRHSHNRSCPLSEASFIDNPGFRERWNRRTQPANDPLSSDVEQAIRELSKAIGADCLLEYPDDKSLRIAVDALRRIAPANDPLTLDELRGMDKEPVWIDEREEPKYSGWYIAYWDRGKYLVLQSISTHGFLMDEYGKTWLAYRRPPDKEG